MGMKMKELFKKYDCNPMKALALPLLQAPIFMSFFFGLRKMPDYFHEQLSTGGILWFTDLSVPDPLYIMPVVSAASFVLMVELGKEQMLASNAQQGQTMLTVFRGLGVIMVPLTLNFSSAVFCYWVTNNSLSLLQSMAFQRKSIRKALGIWELPKPTPGAPPPKSIVETLQEVMQSTKNKNSKKNEINRIKEHNEIIENRKERVSRRRRRGGRR